MMPLVGTGLLDRACHTHSLPADHEACDDMTHTLWDPIARKSLFDRLAALEPTATPLWGRFSAHGMVVHLVDSARMALGTMPVRMARGAPARIVRLPGVRHLFVYVLPFPRNAPTMRELLSSPPGDWSADLATFVQLTEELARRATDMCIKWPAHPFFGPLTCRDWGVLGYRHTNHHLRQFGA